MLDVLERQITWSSSDSISVSAVATATSDVVTFSQNAISAQIHVKIASAGTYNSYDTVQAFFFASCGDPDGAGSAEYPYSIVCGKWLGTLRMAYVTSQNLQIVVPVVPVLSGKLVVFNRSASVAVIASACIVEKLAP